MKVMRSFVSFFVACRLQLAMAENSKHYPENRKTKKKTLKVWIFKLQFALFLFNATTSRLQRSIYKKSVSICFVYISVIHTSINKILNNRSLQLNLQFILYKYKSFLRPFCEPLFQMCVFCVFLVCGNLKCNLTMTILCTFLFCVLSDVRFGSVWRWGGEV